MSKPGPSFESRRVNEAALAVVAPKPTLFPKDTLPQVAFAGRSNVGKSSIINALTGRKKLAYTSSSPGKTRQVFYYLIDKVFYFVDLPGYGYARIPKTERAYFKVLVDAYFDRSKTLRGCVLLLDPRRPVGEEEMSFLHYLSSRSIPAIVVFTKWDRVRSTKRPGLLKARKAEFAGLAGRVLCTSARTKEGVDVLWKAIDECLQTGGEG